MSDEKKSSWDEPRHAKFTHEEDVAFLRRAIEVSRLSREHGNTPFGAILVDEHKNIVLEQENREITEHICTGHAETSLMEAASKIYDHDFLWQCSIYITGEPCAMCAGAILSARIPRVVYGASDRKFGACRSVCSLFDMNFNHHPQVVSGILEEESAALLRAFFQNLRVELRSRPKWRKPAGE